ncbi:MAG: M23 family metallopeptidase [Oscillospiraceae bacterium]|nr:M23 family metallopeptidase [Oscillospiraceae bacterium]
MKNETNQQKRVRPKSFYTALIISLAMIGAACAYAYQATTATLEESLDSIQNELTAETEPTSQPAYTTSVTEASHEAYGAAAQMQTQLPAEEQVTEPVTEPATEPSTQTTAGESFAHVLVMPLQGEVISQFSGGELVKSETTGTWQTHNGMDIAADEGTPVCAIDNGTVADVTKDALWGICVEIDHGNGVVSRYCGLSPSLSVKAGDTVESGQTMGAVGSTADIESKQASHLHFEVLKNDVYVDPAAYVNGQ